MGLQDLLILVAIDEILMWMSVTIEIEFSREDPPTNPHTHKERGEGFLKKLIVVYIQKVPNSWMQSTDFKSF